MTTAPAPAPETIELNDAAWAEARESMAQRFLGMSADDFVQRYNAGDFDTNEPVFLMDVLAFFPELD